MCNLSVGVYRRGIDKGIGMGIDLGIDKGEERQKKKTIIRMLEKKADVDFIASVNDCTQTYVKKIAEEMHITI